jgi:hypothetical protein
MVFPLCLATIGKRRAGPTKKRKEREGGLNKDAG